MRAEVYYAYILYQRLLDVRPKYNFFGMRTEVYTSYIHLFNRFSALGPKNDTSFLSMSLTKFGMGTQIDKMLAHKIISYMGTTKETTGMGTKE